MEVSYVKVHDPVLVHSALRKELTQRPFIILSLLVLAVGSALIAAQIGGTSGMIKVAASTGGGIIGIGLLYVAINECLKRRQNYTIEEIMEVLGKETSHCGAVMGQLTLDSMVKMITYLNKYIGRHAPILPNVCYAIVKARPRKDIQGEIYNFGENMSGSTWYVICDAYKQANLAVPNVADQLKLIVDLARPYRD